MLGNRPAQESELVGPICARFGLSIESSRLLISEGRKVGFVVDCGALPQSVRCFVEEFPTPSTSLERNSSRGKALCLLPNGFKVVGLVEGSVYLGEVVYDENWKRSYKFHLVEGPDIVKSSSPCSNPTSAFKEIEAVIKVTSTKKRHRKPDARSNGKLYMAVMYSATQRLLREKFRGCENQVPPDVRPLFIEWMENVSSSKAFTGTNGPESSFSATHSTQPLPAIPKHVVSTANKVHPIPSQGAPTALPGIKKEERNPSVSSRFGFFDLESDIVNGDLHLTLDDANIEAFLNSDKPFETGQPSSSTVNTAPLPTLNGRKRGSGSLDDFMHPSQSAVDPLATRKRGSGSIDEQSPVLLTRKRASGSIDEDSVLLKDLETLQKRQDNPPPPNIHPHAPVVADAGELFADYFRIPDIQLQPKTNIAIPPAPALHPAALGPSLLSPRDGNIALPPFEDLIDPADLFAVTSAQINHTLRNPQKRSFTPTQMRAAIASLLQIPRESVPLRAVEEVFAICDRSRTGAVTIESFLEALDTREKELLEQFRKIDKENTGEITLEALRAARTQGAFRGEENEMGDLLVRLDSLSFSPAHPMAGNRKMQFHDFRAMFLPLPSTATLRGSMEHAKSSSGNESLDMDLFHL